MRWLVVAVLLVPVVALAHSGGTDRNGCHNSRTGYHCHGSSGGRGGEDIPGGSVRSGEPRQERDLIGRFFRGTSSREAADAGVSSRPDAGSRPHVADAGASPGTPDAGISEAPDAGARADGASVKPVAKTPARPPPRPSAKQRATAQDAGVAAPIVTQEPYRPPPDPALVNAMVVVMLACPVIALGGLFFLFVRWTAKPRPPAAPPPPPSPQHVPAAVSPEDAERNARDESEYHQIFMRLNVARGPAERRTLMARAAQSISSQSLRERLMLQASRIDTEAELDKVEGFTSKDVKRRRLAAALARLKGDGLPDALQADLIAAVEQALRDVEGEPD